MNKVKFYVKDKVLAKNIYEEAKKVFETYGIKEVDKDYDIAIAIGGDGTFLKMLRANLFDSNIIYAGISAGTLGFLHDLNRDEIKSLAEAIINENYNLRERLVEEIDIDGKKDYALNEIVIRNKDLSVLGVKVNIDDDMLENIEGDGVLVCTPTGSSAYNLSLGGAIIYDKLKCLELTPIAPLNTKVYRCISRSIIIPDNTKLDLLIHEVKNCLTICLDGHNYEYNNVQKISVSISKNKIKSIYLNKKNYTDVLNDKLLD